MTSQLNAFTKTSRRRFLPSPGIVALAGLLVLAAYGRHALALPDDLEVLLDDLNKPGEFSAEVIASYALSRPRTRSDEELQPTFHVLQVSPEFSWGLAKNVQFNVQLFSSLNHEGHGTLDGGQLELLAIPIRPDDEDDDGFFAGGMVEIGRLPRTISTNKLDGEVTFLLGYRSGKWTVATNLEADFKVSGNGSSAPDLSAKIKLGYKTTASYSIGFEYYGDLGELRDIGPLSQESQHLFAVVDFKHKGWSFNVGVGRGLNAFSEPWVLKAVFELPFGD